MADNVTLNSGSGGAVIATDDDGVAQHQYVKVEFGADNTQTKVTASSGLPVTPDSGGFAVQEDGAALTALQLIDDAVHTDDAAFTLGTSKGVMMMGFAGTQLVDANDAAAIAVDTDGAIHVSDGGNSLTVDGTVTGSGDWDVQGGDAENAAVTKNPVQVGGRYDASPRTLGSGDVGAIALDADGAVHISDGGNTITVDGTVTANPASGTIDTVTTVTAVTDITNTIDSTISGAALTALQLIDDPVFADDAAFTLASSKVNMAGAIRDDALSTLTAVEGDAVPLRVSSTGALHVTGGGGGTEYNEDVATPATITGTATMMERDDALSTLTPIEGDWAAMRCSAEGALWVQEFNSDAILADTANMDTNLGTIAGAITGTEMQVDVVASLPAGTNAIGKLAANSGVDIGDVDVTSISAGSNLIGDVGLSGARTSGGTTLYKNIDVDESEDQIKGTAGQVYWIHAMNLSASTKFLKFYNATAASVTVGTTTPDLTFPLATQGDTNGAGFTLSIPNGIAFGTAITIAATTGVADNDSGAPGANEVVVNIGYA